MKWYKRDPDAAISGMIGLTMEERGAYNTVLDYLYSRDGNCPSDDVFWSRAQGCRPQVWRRVRDALIAKGKIRIEEGKLTANRVQTEVKTASKLIEKMTVLRQKQLSNQRALAGATARTTTTTTREEEREESVVLSFPKQDSDPASRGAGVELKMKDPKSELYALGEKVLGKRESGALVTMLLKMCNGVIPHALGHLHTASAAHKPAAYVRGILNRQTRRDRDREEVPVIQ